MQTSTQNPFPQICGEDFGVCQTGFSCDAWRRCLDVPPAVAACAIDLPPTEARPPLQIPLPPDPLLAGEPWTVTLPSGCVGDNDPSDSGFKWGEPATVQLAMHTPQAVEPPALASVGERAAAMLEGPAPAVDALVPSVQGPTDERSQVAAVENEGSIGHPFCCSRPCMFFATGTCANAASCSYCHLPHLKRPVHLDRQNRAYFDSLPPHRRVSRLMSLIRKKVTGAGLMDQMGHPLEDLDSACGVLCNREVSTSCHTTCNKNDRALRAALSGMAIRPLLTMLERTVGLGNTEAALAVEAFWSHCRAGFQHGCLEGTQL